MDAETDVSRIRIWISDQGSLGRPLGGFTGFEAFVFYFPASGHTFIVFSNYWDSALPLIDRMDK